MQALVRRQVRLGIKGVLRLAAAALLFAAVLCQSRLANASPNGGGGGFHGGGFHGGGFHGGGFHGGHFGEFHGHGFHGHGFGGFHRGGFGILAWPYYPYPYGSDYYPEYDYDPGQYSAPRTWYYCYDPTGYYPYVTQCNTGWQAVPG
jgi:hypothetical protein